MRYNERQIRRWKREYVAMDAAGLDTSEASVRLRAAQARQTDFISKTGMKRQSAREMAAGFGRSQAVSSIKEAEQIYQNWSKSIGANDQIKTLAKYYDVKYNDSPRYELLKTYVRSVESGRMSPMVRFDLYEDYYRRIQTELVGKQTKSGITITGQSKHFLERVFGTMIDPKTHKPRSGVVLDVIIQCVTTSTDISDPVIRADGKRSIVILAEGIAVSVNPDTGILVQTNPKEK